jgi:hypothetical protein
MAECTGTEKTRVANSEHLELLRQGVEVWNAWRIKEPSAEPDLSRADLSRMDLSRMDLSGAKLSGADLFGANLSGANLSWGWAAPGRCRTPCNCCCGR